SQIAEKLRVLWCLLCKAVVDILAHLEMRLPYGGPNPCLPLLSCRIALHVCGQLLQAPCANPRHPACATPSTRAWMSVITIGKQSAVSTASTHPVSRVNAASALMGIGAVRIFLLSSTTSVPCTCRSQCTGPGNNDCSC